MSETVYGKRDCGVGVYCDRGKGPGEELCAAGLLPGRKTVQLNGGIDKIAQNPIFRRLPFLVVVYTAVLLIVPLTCCMTVMA
jgi:hypothetical protein